MPEKGATKVVRGGRLVWHMGNPDENHWYEHWAARLHGDYLAKAKVAKIGKTELGRVLLAELPKEGPQLEAGCGAGWWLAALVAQGYDLTGIEYSQRLVDLVKSVDPEVPIEFGDATAVECEDGHYTAYLSFGVVEHVESGPKGFLDEAARILAPGGVAVINVPGFGPFRRLKAKLGLYRGKVDGLPFFQYGFTAEEFADLIAASGLTIKSVQYMGVHRMLSEELPGYVWLTRQRFIGKRFRALVERLLDKRDGHMVLVVATKPATA